MNGEGKVKVNKHNVTRKRYGNTTFLNILTIISIVVYFFFGIKAQLKTGEWYSLIQTLQVSKALT